jgi:hypothetical protein
MAVFWDVAPCNLIDIDRRFGGGYCQHYQVRKQAVSSSATSEYRTTPRNIPEDSHIHSLRLGNLKSDRLTLFPNIVWNNINLMIEYYARSRSVISRAKGENSLPDGTSVEIFVKLCSRPGQK